MVPDYGSMNSRQDQIDGGLDYEICDLPVSVVGAAQCQWAGNICAREVMMFVH